MYSNTSVIILQLCCFQGSKIDWSLLGLNSHLGTSLHYLETMSQNANSYPREAFFINIDCCDCCPA